MKGKNKVLKLLTLLSLVLFLTACRTSNEPITSESTGFWDGFILYNLSRFIIWLSNLFWGNYGVGIILFTIIMRILLIPLYQMQIKSQNKMQELQPGLDAIKAKYPNPDTESMARMQEEQANYLSENGVNQFSNLIPLLVQLPLMIALYQAILRTEVLRQGHFLWMNLGQPDPYYILPILAALLTYYNTYLTMKANPIADQSPKFMMYSMPIMILLLTLNLPSAIGLYWVTSNLFNVIQTLLFNNPYQKIADKEAEREEEKERQRRLRRAYRNASGKRKK